MELSKVWKDEDNRRWYLFDSEEYPYISASSLVAIAKAYRYKDMTRDDKSNKRLKRAGQLGTDIHNVLEWHNRIGLGTCDGMENPPTAKHLARYNQIHLNHDELISLISMNEGKVEIIEVETRVSHPIYKYAGRFDLLVKVDGEYEVWDYKTGRKVYEEDGWQLAGYMYALRQAGIDVKRVRILHIDKISSRITELKYVHHEYMFLKFLGLIEIFKGMYFNDLSKGRINDIHELGVKYKWPIKELLNNYVIDFIQTKGDNNMELQEVTGLGERKSFAKDPNKVYFSDAEPVMGAVLGAVNSRWVHKANKKVFACPGKDVCERCKLGMRKNVQFKFMFLTLDDNDAPVIKYIESESTRLYFALNDAFKQIKEDGGDVRTAVLNIVRTGQQFDTQYAVTTIAPKHKALQNIAETIKPMEALDVSLAPTADEESQGGDHTDFVQETA